MYFQVLAEREWLHSVPLCMPCPWPLTFSVSFSLHSHPHPWLCLPSLSDVSSHVRLSPVSVTEGACVSDDEDCETCRACESIEEVCVCVCVWGGGGGELCRLYQS